VVTLESLTRIDSELQQPGKVRGSLALWKYAAFVIPV
jgi:hypothetical protein